MLVVFISLVLVVLPFNLFAKEHGSDGNHCSCNDHVFLILGVLKL